MVYTGALRTCSLAKCGYVGEKGIKAISPKVFGPYNSCMGVSLFFFVLVLVCLVFVFQDTGFLCVAVAVLELAP